MAGFWCFVAGLVAGLILGVLFAKPSPRELKILLKAAEEEQRQGEEDLFV